MHGVPFSFLCHSIFDATIPYVAMSTSTYAQRKICTTLNRNENESNQNEMWLHVKLIKTKMKFLMILCAMCGWFGSMIRLPIGRCQFRNMLLLMIISSHLCITFSVSVSDQNRHMLQFNASHLLSRPFQNQFLFVHFPVHSSFSLMTIYMRYSHPLHFTLI